MQAAWLIDYARTRFARTGERPGRLGGAGEADAAEPVGGREPQSTRP
jgi:hypothetical protein